MNLRAAFGRSKGGALCRPPAGGYAVVDLETTGMSWDGGDRVLEIAVVLLDDRAQPTGAWTTLINPGRPVASGEVHGITDRDVLHAPGFADVAGLLAESCRGRVFVAHSIAFDSLFVRKELELAGHFVGLDASTGLCTAELGGHYLPHVAVGLDELCYAAGITIRRRHWALWDAEATGRLLRYYIGSDFAFARHWCRQIERSLALEWPAFAARAVRLLPRCAPTAGHPDDDWCGVCAPRDDRQPPLPGRPRTA
jgi:DNA polymerase-3 subunit epsilon